MLTKLNLIVLTMNDSDLEFSTGVELAQTLNGFLAMHHGGDGGALLSVRERRHSPQNKSLFRYSML